MGHAPQNERQGLSVYFALTPSQSHSRVLLNILNVSRHPSLMLACLTGRTRGVYDAVMMKVTSFTGMRW